MAEAADAAMLRAPRTHRLQWNQAFVVLIAWAAAAAAAYTSRGSCAPWAPSI